jgi:hypothetical protein
VVIISFSWLSNLTGCFFSGWDCGGQEEVKSPPGPNLHTGSPLAKSRFSADSICLSTLLFILRDSLIVNASIGNAVVKTLTKTEQKSAV